MSQETWEFAWWTRGEADALSAIHVQHSEYAPRIA